MLLLFARMYSYVYNKNEEEKNMAMQFEKQRYQDQCVDNIITVLKECDVYQNNFDNMSKAIDTRFKKSMRNRLDVLMETGTGKTFTYLKAIFEIHKHFNKNKFVIIVPRRAIKLGVIQNIELTKYYFFQEYGKYLSYINYPEEGLGKIEHDFLKTDDLTILITTHSAFNSDKNKINQSTERLFEHGSVWQGIREKQPIIIIDEPHLLKGSKTQKGLETLNDSLQIRFGATFPKDTKDEEQHLSNVVYALDSISAFNQYLVKRIAVDTIISDSEQSELKVTDTNKKSFTVMYAKNSIIFKETIFIGDDIGAKTGIKKYNTISATKINKGKVFLSDKSTLDMSTSYDVTDIEIRHMVKKTIENHFEKEEKFFEKGIKTLSLFFIPKIKDFRDSDNKSPRIKKIFEQEYRKQREVIFRDTKNKMYKQYLSKDISEDGMLQVHEGYFSGDKGKTKEDREADGVNMILNEKEKLLSFDTPLRFIFSVWALQEGWDNPNIFTICKLSSTSKDTSRRQQVGRGLRIAVNQKGHRFTHLFLNEDKDAFHEINTLDIVVSGKEKDFIEGIQNEIQEASFSLVGDTITLEKLEQLGFNDTERCFLFTILLQNGVIDPQRKIRSSLYEFLKHNKDNLKDKLAVLGISETRYQEMLDKFTENTYPVTDKNKLPQAVNIKPKQWESFKVLWETINKKATIVYKDIEEESIIEQVAELFNKESIEPVSIKIHKAIYNTQKDKIESIQEERLEEVSFFKVQTYSDFISYFMKDEKLPLHFLLKLFNKIDIQKIKCDPQKAKEHLLRILKETIHTSIINQVSYNFNETTIYPNKLQDKKGNAIQNINSTLLGKYHTLEAEPEHLLYDTICYDSDIEKELQKEPSNVNKQTITVFAKLPRISIPTPYKNYNPDFAYLIETKDCKKLFLVVETKGYKREGDIPIEEQNKIAYAKKFFEILQQQLPDIDIQYKTRISTQSLSDIIENKQ